MPEEAPVMRTTFWSVTGLFPLRWLTQRSRYELISTDFGRRNPHRWAGRREPAQGQAQRAHLAAAQSPAGPAVGRHPKLDRVGQHGATGVGQGDDLHTTVDRVRPAYDQTALFERLQIGCGRRRVHGEPLGKVADGNRGRLVKREQGRELSVGEAARTKDVVDMPGHHSPGPLYVQAQAGLG